MTGQGRGTSLGSPVSKFFFCIILPIGTPIKRSICFLRQRCCAPSALWQPQRRSERVRQRLHFCVVYSACGCQVVTGTGEPAVRKCIMMICAPHAMRHASCHDMSFQLRMDAAAVELLL